MTRAVALATAIMILAVPLPGAAGNVYVTDTSGTRMLVEDIGLLCRANMLQYINFSPVKSAAIALPGSDADGKPLVTLELKDIVSLELLDRPHGLAREVAGMRVVTRDGTRYEISADGSKVVKHDRGTAQELKGGVLKPCSHEFYYGSVLELRGERIYDWHGFQGRVHKDGTSSLFEIPQGSVVRVDFLR